MVLISKIWRFLQVNVFGKDGLCRCTCIISIFSLRPISLKCDSSCTSKLIFLIECTTHNVEFHKINVLLTRYAFTTNVSSFCIQLLPAYADTTKRSLVVCGLGKLLAKIYFILTSYNFLFWLALKLPSGLPQSSMSSMFFFSARINLEHLINTVFISKECVRTLLLCRKHDHDSRFQFENYIVLQVTLMLLCQQPRDLKKNNILKLFGRFFH